MVFYFPEIWRNELRELRILVVAKKTDKCRMSSDYAGPAWLLWRSPFAFVVSAFGKIATDVAFGGTNSSKSRIKDGGEE
jgi:hypothetical protein